MGCNLTSNCLPNLMIKYDVQLVKRYFLTDPELAFLREEQIRIEIETKQQIKDLTDSYNEQILLVEEIVKKDYNEFLSKTHQDYNREMYEIEKKYLNQEDQLFGYSEAQNQFQSLKLQTHKRIQILSLEVLNDIQQKYSDLSSLIQRSRPNLPLFKKYPEKDQAKIKKQAEIEFQAEFQNNKNRYKSKLEECNFSNYAKWFRDVLPKKQLETLSYSKYQFQTCRNELFGCSLNCL